VNPKEWITVAGVLLILLATLAEATDEKPYERHAKRMERLERAGIGYGLAIVAWFSTMSILDWRRGLAAIGVPAAASWMLAPIGPIVIIALSIAAFYSGDKGQARWKRVAIPLLYLAVVVGYSFVVYRAHN
jgi:hypothetical protein